MRLLEVPQTPALIWGTWWQHERKTIHLVESGPKRFLALQEEGAQSNGHLVEGYVDEVRKAAARCLDRHVQAVPAHPR